MKTLNYNFEKWTPTEKLGVHYDIDGIIQNEEGLSFTFTADKRNDAEKIKSFIITWNASDIITYNVTDETYRADCWKMDFENDGRFYICTNSGYIDFFKQKSPLFPECSIHFLIVGTNTVVDVIAKNYPKVTVMK